MKSLPGLLALAFMLAAASVARAESAPDRPAPGPIHVEVRPISVPLLRDIHVVGRFDMQILLSVDNPKQQARVERLLPRLEAAYFSDISDLAQYYLTPGKPADLPFIGRVLQTATDRVLGSDTARVLIQEAAIRR